MNKSFIKDAFGWGFMLWLIGYALGMVFFSLVPLNMIGWVILPIGTAITLWVLFKKTSGADPKYYAFVGLAWLVLTIVLDWLFLVKAFKVTGYYKPSVFVYYALMLVLPILTGFKKKRA
jgi:hypothetical protein